MEKKFSCENAKPSRRWCAILVHHPRLPTVSLVSIQPMALIPNLDAARKCFWKVGNKLNDEREEVRRREIEEGGACDSVALAACLIRYPD